jgi:hypothetical protein
MHRALLVLPMFILVLGIASCGERPRDVSQDRDAEGGIFPSGPAENQGERQTAEGSLTRIDEDARMIWITARDGNQLQFSYSDRTEIDGAGDTVEGLASMQGNNLRVEYESSGGVNTAVKITVLPAGGTF